jgi:uncharacterized membrane protein (UPF0127 family)
MKRYILIILVGAALVALYFLFFHDGKKAHKPYVDNPRRDVQYRIDGTIFFTRADGDTITKLYVEVADDPYSHARGLMYRSSMPDTVGMLFIYNDYDYRSFWMKNTHISLDLVFINDQFLINQVHEYAIPYSEESIISKDKAKYVVEVNAGYTDRHRIGPGQSTIINLK